MECWCCTESDVLRSATCAFNSELTWKLVVMYMDTRVHITRSTPLISAFGSGTPGACPVDKGCRPLETVWQLCLRQLLAGCIHILHARCTRCILGVSVSGEPAARVSSCSGMRACAQDFTSTDEQLVMLQDVPEFRCLSESDQMHGSCCPL